MNAKGRTGGGEEAAEMMHTLTCNAVGDLSSIVQEAELFPPQGLASLLVSEFVPGEEVKGL